MTAPAASSFTPEMVTFTAQTVAARVVANKVATDNLPARITGGNFWLLHRLFVQIGDILKNSGLFVITDEVVEGEELIARLGLREAD